MGIRDGTGNRLYRWSFADELDSAGRLLKQFSGLSKERMKSGQIRDSREIDYLPVPRSMRRNWKPTSSVGVIAWSKMLCREQVREQVERLVDQAAAERQRALRL
ncbi:MAG: hypothetical protein Ct9H300mP8_00890 [Gammaproteobacteria bacterium]|nr:MAG: hypothetical protein Ct9H300mP8_00890 [Gammaproteobacteria bacterium]